jgi:hypothetical protein
MLDGTRRREFKELTVSRIETRCPSKWAFVDMETGDIWIPNPKAETKYDSELKICRWRYASYSDLVCIKKAVYSGCDRLHSTKQERDSRRK